ncbi:MAG: hypothetical protein K9M57_10430 [Phycisphaerae bacterium]|nr:hypothetical protein [Phycisphaerae bacterium]
MKSNINNFETCFLSLKTDLSAHYSRLSEDHDRLRSELMARLPETVCNPDRSMTLKQRRTNSFALNSRFIGVIRSAAAIAAVLALVVGVTMVMNSTPVDTAQMAWARTIDSIDQVQTIHYVYTTHPNRPHGQSSMEIWWQRPGNYRMEMNTGVIYSFDGKHRYEYNPATQKLKISDGPGIETIFLNELGDFGQLCQDSDSPTFSRELIEESKVVRTEDVTYKGEKCYKVTSENSFVDTMRIFEYIVDKKVSERSTPILYEVKQYWKSNQESKTLKSLTEVIKIDGQMDSKLFTVDPTGTLLGRHRRPH